jgi:hypothetical protein
MQGTAQISFLDGVDAATSKAWPAGDRDVRAFTPLSTTAMRHLVLMQFKFDV